MNDERHDGRLDEYQNGYNDARVSHEKQVAVLVMEESGNHLTYVPGILIDGVGDAIALTASQALSLLAWLKHEQATLERLVQEQTA